MAATDTSIPELTFRARKILYAVITEYIATGEPVGSRRLSRRYGLNLSPASIRNVLADLEDTGLLAQPHASAGRVPTDAGFRVFVDALVQMQEVTTEEKAVIVSKLKSLRPGEHDIMRETGALLSTLTAAAAVVSKPRAEEQELAQLRFVPLRPGQVLAVLVTRGGTVQNRVLEMAMEVPQTDLERVHNHLSEMLEGRTLIQVRDALAEEMADDRGPYVTLSRLSKQMVDATLSSSDERPEIVIQGQERLFDRPEFGSAEKIRAFLRTFEDRELLLDLVDRTLGAGGVQVVIGSEANLVEVQDISLITASYRRSGGATGAVGIIGPARMDYGKLVPLVEFTAHAVGRVLDPDVDEE